MKIQKITKANAKKFDTAICEFLDGIGAERKQRSKNTHWKNQWLLRTVGGPLWLTLDDDNAGSNIYTLFAQFEIVERAKEFFVDEDKSLNRHSGKWNFHYEDLDEGIREIKLHLNVKRLEQQSIKARIYSDDHRLEKTFNAIEWFEQASEKQIIALAECNFGGDYPADAVGIFMAAKSKDVEDVFTYIKILVGSKDAPGFEVHVDVNDGLAWIEENFEELYAKIIADRNEKNNGELV